MTGKLTKPEVLTIGESMVLFQTIENGKLQYAHSLVKSMAGAEANFAIGLTRLGKHISWMSRLGADSFGEYIFSTLRGEGVDIGLVEWDDENPTGVMFKEIQGEMDPSVLYYRKGSAASCLTPESIDKSILEGVKLFHFTGITPALSEGCKELVFKACKLARESGTIVSFDPNMRRKLWTEEDARDVFTDLVKLSDIVLPGVDEAELITGESNIDTMADKILKMGPSQVVMKVGAEGSVLYHKKNDSDVEKVKVKGFPVKTVVDSVGAGDGFAAGYLSAYLDNLPPLICLERANAIGALVTQYRGDWEGLPKKKEVERFIQGIQDVTR